MPLLSLISNFSQYYYVWQCKILKLNFDHILTIDLLRLIKTSGAEMRGRTQCRINKIMMGKVHHVIMKIIDFNQNTSLPVGFLKRMNNKMDDMKCFKH